MSELRLDWTNRGQAYEVDLGDVVRVSLLQNGTTGYFWSRVPVPDDLFEEIVGESGEGAPPRDPPAILGSGTMRELAFRARRPGTRNLGLRYSRGVESPDDVDYEVEIKVRGQ